MEVERIFWVFLMRVMFIIGLLFLVLGLCSITMMWSQTQYTESLDVTISEKYPSSAYSLATVVTSDGTILYFGSTNDWAPVKVGHNYTLTVGNAITNRNVVYSATDIGII